MDKIPEKKVSASDMITDVPETPVTRKERVVVKASPLEKLLGAGGAEGREGVGVYGFAFDNAVRYMESVLRKMSDFVGWKGQDRPYDFDRFSGYYPEIGPGSVNICHGEDVVATFYPKEDGSLGYEAYGDEFVSMYPDDVNPWYPLTDIMDGRLCLESANLEAARGETHGGNVVVYGLRFGDECAYCADAGDRELRHALVNRDVNIRLVTPERFEEALDAWYASDIKPGFEGRVRPELVYLAWDGAKLRDERELAIFQERDVRNGWMDDWDLIGALREEGQKIRRELQEAAGIRDERLFRFDNALYPNLGIRGDALFLSTSYGSLKDFITVAKGRVGFYRDYDPEKPLPVPAKVFPSVKEALDRVRKVVLSPANVEVAAKEYQSYLKKIHNTLYDAEKVAGSKVAKKEPGEKPSGPKI